MNRQTQQPEPDYYWIDEDDVRKLRRISDALMGGTDRERDYGHRVWLILNNLITPTNP